MKKNVLIIGAGGVAQVVAHKCAQNNDVLGDIHIASRTVEKCEAIVASGLARQALHAAVLGFVHPVTGERLRFESPLPADMAALERLLSSL